MSYKYFLEFWKHYMNVTFESFPNVPKQKLHERPTEMILK